MTSGPGTIPYRPSVELVLSYTNPQLIGDQPVGVVGDDFHSVRGGINHGDVCVCSRVVGVIYVRVDGL